MADAQTLTVSLGGRWLGRYGTAPCPVCQPERRSGQSGLSIREDGGRLLMHCFKSGCDFRDIATAAGITPGTYSSPDLAALAKRDAERQAEVAKRERQARAIWAETLPIGGTLAEAYLQGRGITCPLPETLRFHPECWHGPTARRYPAMVALVEGGDGFAVHRTYLRPDGTGKAALDGGDKLMLGATAGGAVRLSEAAPRLVVAEGIESALSLMCGLLDGPATIWAALSTSGLRGLHLPPISGIAGLAISSAPSLVLAADGDQPGREAAHALAERAHGLGWRVSVLDPGNGADFNDHLTGKAVAV